MARVLMKTRVQIHEGDELNVPVVVQEWIDDAYELGFLRDQHTQQRRLFAIKRFITADDEPGRIVSVLGYRLNPDEHNRIIYEILTATLLCMVFDQDQDRVVIPCFEINEGDWVLSRGHAYLVSASSEHKVLQLGEALPYFLFHLPTRYGVCDSEGCEALLRIAQMALQDFCARGNTLTLSSWADRSRTVSWQPWQDLGCVGDKKAVLDSLIDRTPTGVLNQS